MSKDEILKLKLILKEDVILNIISDNTKYFEGVVFNESYKQITKIAENLESCKKIIEKRKTIITAYNTAVSKYNEADNKYEEIKKYINNDDINNQIKKYKNYIQYIKDEKTLTNENLEDYTKKLNIVNSPKAILNTTQTNLIKEINKFIYENKKTLTPNEQGNMNSINSSEPDAIINFILLKAKKNTKLCDLKTKLEQNDNYKQYKEIKLIIKKLNLQKGGNNSITQKIDNLYIKLIDKNLNINNLKLVYYNFLEAAKKFNVNYIHTYNHLLFIINYLKLIEDNKQILIYKYLGLGTVTYYMRILDRIKQDIKVKNELGKYFYKYHYITINIVYNFLDYLNKNWKAYTNSNSYDNNQTNENKKVITKLNLFGDNISEELKKPIFLFNSFKDILDKYYLQFAPPVGIYLRINDFEDINDTDKVFDVSNELGFISDKQLENCVNSDLKIRNISSKVKFQEVFDSKNFGSNDILSKYMSIPSFLAIGRSIMLITYGYSGVGKTFTIFGNSTSSGVLQSSLNSIENKLKTYYRIYEIYGMAFPYKSYWDRDANSYYHEIIEYTFMENKVTSYSKKNMEDYINKILINNDNEITNNNSTFKELSSEELKKFNNIVSNVDKKRVEKGTIKRTINNRESSRSIIVYDFKIKIGENKYVNFVVMDLPGKENIFETFVSKKENIIQQTNNDSTLNTNELAERLDKQYECISPRDPSMYNSYGKEMFMSMAYLNPMSLMTIKSLHDKLVNNKNIYNLINDPGFIFSINGKNITLNNEPTTKANRITSFNDVLGLEIMRNIINLNRFDLLEEFYNSIFTTIDENDSVYDINENGKYKKEKYKCSNKKYSLAPFEGYYINENIIGLLNTLLINLGLNDNKDFVTEQPNIYLTNNELKTSLYEFKLLNDEIICQTYFFRYFIRNLQISKDYVYKKKSDTAKSTYIHNIPKEFSTKYKTKPLKYWFTETYDYNKAFKINDPPIATFLKPYFEVMNNFYVFYVVSNMNKEKCDKQIKLISDSEEFLKRLGNFDPIKYNLLKKSMNM